MFPLLFNQYFWENFFGSSPSASFKAIFLCLADTSRIKWCGITELTTKGSHEALLHQKKKTRKEGGPDNTLGILKTFKMLNLLLIKSPSLRPKTTERILPPSLEFFVWIQGVHKPGLEKQNDICISLVPNWTGPWTSKVAAEHPGWTRQISETHLPAQPYFATRDQADQSSNFLSIFRAQMRRSKTN